MKCSLCAAAILICGLTAWAHEGHGTAHAPVAAKKLINPLTSSPDQLQAGEALYGKQCASCHGPDGKSNTAVARKQPVRPANLADYQMDSMADGEIYWVVKHGIPPSMPAIPAATGDSSVWQIQLWVRELRIKQRAFERARAGDYEWHLPPGFPYPNVPKDNPMTAAKVELGRFLFYDKRLSENQTQSCATCHQQRLAFTDGKPRGEGSTGEMHSRGPMSLVNVAYSPALTWANPNVRRLETQALVPLFGENPVEMGMNGKEDVLLARLKAEPRYGPLFAKAFPGDTEPFTLDHVTKGLASFERTIISGRSPYDQYRFSGDSKAISQSAKNGEALFFSEQLECFHCHGGFNFTGTLDYLDKGFAEVEFHNTGLYNLKGETSYPADNTGVYEFTHEPEDIGKFKAPTLRNIAVTGPYMHDGSIATLGEVIDHYKSGGRTIASGPRAGVGADSPNKSEFVREFPLTARQKADLLAFLGSLTDEELLGDPQLGDPWKEQRLQTLRGVVRSVNAEAGTLVVRDAGKGTIMPGMTMQFRVHDRAKLKNLKAGASIEAETRQEGSDYYLLHLHSAASAAR